jgi:DNA mismatch endonuclease, patch repair protein
MADIFTTEKRSWVMSRIRGSNTRIDLIMKLMFADTRYKFEKNPEKCRRKILAKFHSR